MAAESLLTPSQLARYLGVPVNTVYAWRTRGIGPRAFRVGRHTRYRLEDITAWLEQRTTVSGDSRATRKEVDPQEAA